MCVFVFVEVCVDVFLSVEDVVKVKIWFIWGCEVSEFLWMYGLSEICYVIEGECVVILDDGLVFVCLMLGMFVIFFAGMFCTWNVTKAIKKYYFFY